MAELHYTDLGDGIYCIETGLYRHGLAACYLVREGDQLPKKGKKTFKAEESLRAGVAGSIKFKLWEGSIEDPVSDNRFIGMFEIKGSDFSDGVIAKETLNK